MSNLSLRDVSLTTLRKYFGDKSGVGFSDDFYFFNAKLTQESKAFAHPFRIDSYLFILCESGSLRLDVNLCEVELKKNMILVLLKWKPI